MHGTVGRAHGNAVLVEVGVRAVLEAPALAPRVMGTIAGSAWQVCTHGTAAPRPGHPSFSMRQHAGYFTVIASPADASRRNLAWVFSGFERLMVISIDPQSSACSNTFLAMAVRRT